MKGERVKATRDSLLIKSERLRRRRRRQPLRGTTRTLGSSWWSVRRVAGPGLLGRWCGWPGAGAGAAALTHWLEEREYDNNDYNEDDDDEGTTASDWMDGKQLEEGRWSCECVCRVASRGKETRDAGLTLDPASRDAWRPATAPHPLESPFRESREAQAQARVGVAYATSVAPLLSIG